MCDLHMDSDSITKELRDAYAAMFAEYREKALRLQMMAMNAMIDTAVVQQAADEVAALAQKLGDMRSALKLYLDARLAPSRAQF